MPEVSVIMPAHNCGVFIENGVRSVLGQSFKDLELVIVDDGSTDDTPKIVKSLLKDKRCTYIRETECRGPSAARNIGIDNARGKMIAFLDADDIFLENKIEEQVFLLRRKPSYGACYTDQIYFDEEAGKEIRSSRYSFSGDIFYFIKRSNFIPICALMMRREALGENRFDERPQIIGHEDWELFLRLALQGVRFFYIGKPLTKIRVRKGSVTTRETMKESRKNVGLQAKGYWKAFKKTVDPLTREGQKAILRYAALKTKALLIGFPREKRFNEPAPQQLL